MNTPPPVNLNALSGILANAKKLMAITDTNKPLVMSEGMQSQTNVEEQENALAYKAPTSVGYTNEQVMASNFPQNVKDAMMKKNPAPVQNFKLEDDSELDDIKMTPNKRQPYTTQPTSLNENRSGSDMITISKSELKQMISEGVQNYLTQSYNKTLSESVIKQTMNILIKEGKLTLKK
jgi:hypothetical protein